MKKSLVSQIALFYLLCSPRYSTLQHAIVQSTYYLKINSVTTAFAACDNTGHESTSKAAVSDHGITKILVSPCYLPGGMPVRSVMCNIQAG